MEAWMAAVNQAYKAQVLSNNGVPPLMLFNANAHANTTQSSAHDLTTGMTHTNPLKPGDVHAPLCTGWTPVPAEQWWVEVIRNHSNRNNSSN